MMTRRDTTANSKLWRAALACVVLALLAAPALAQQEIEPGDAAVAAAREKICEGKYKLAGGGESIISVICPNLNSTCTCTSTGIDCGGTTKAAPAGGTFVEGSCKTTYTSTAAVEAETLAALYRAIFAPEE